MPGFEESQRPRRQADDSGGWPAIEHETLPWESKFATATSFGRYAGGPAEYQAAVPPLIAERTPTIRPGVAALARAAEQELIRFDAALGDEMAGFAPLLLRSEAAASSQIEHLTASSRAILTAEIAHEQGATVSQRNANEIVGNTLAMRSALALADQLTPDSVREMHRALMDGTNHTPGEWRTEPVWIGASARSPEHATFVAPRYERVAELIDDVMAFARREDLPVLVQTAVAHAQFETIHPFTDGNGRTGRALVQAMLRNKEVTRSVVVPVSAGLLTDVAAYHAALTAYRTGDPNPIVEQVSLAAGDAIANARQLLEALTGTLAEWRRTVRPRAGSLPDRLLEYATRQPVFTAASAAKALDVAVTNVYAPLKRLQELGILKPKVEYRLGQVWRTEQVLAELDAFASRAGRRGR